MSRSATASCSRPNQLIGAPGSNWEQDVECPKVEGPFRSPQLVSSGNDLFVDLLQKSRHGREDVWSHLAEIFADGIKILGKKDGYP